MVDLLRFLIIDMPETEASLFSSPTLLSQFLHGENSQEMKNKYATSFCNLLRDISDATSCREESETDYHDFLRKIFEKEDADPEEQSQIDAELLAILESEKASGRESEMRKLLLKCCNPDKGILQLCAIPIVGAAGIGKTTLARLIYDDELVLKRFEVRVWVKVGGHELNLLRTAQEILESTMGMACSVDDLDELNEMVRDSLMGQRCLIVFDGVESMTENLWFHMKSYWFGFVDLGSIVLITTPSKDVANLVSNEAFELKQLFPFKVRPLYQCLSIDAMVIVKGIPLLLTLLISMMGCHDKLRKVLSQGDYSDVVFPSNFDASAVILLCIWALPPQLRQCLAFCAVFPKDYALDRAKMINMWVAHGLVKQSPGKNLHDIGNSYFHELLCRSFFTEIARDEYGDVSDFQMPGLIHKIMQDVANVFWKGKVGVIDTIREDAHQLSLHSKGFEGLTTLIPSSVLYSGASSLDCTFLDFQELQSLDLSCSGIRNLSDDICALRELRYLNLSYTLVETLPDSITDLSQLQTLDLSWCYHFKVLPKAIRNLTYMSHLDLSHCESLSHLPSGIGLLISLTSMPLFILGKDHDSARLGELGELNELRGRLDIRNLENVMEISEAHDAKLNQKKLHHLGLCWSKDVNPDVCFKVLEFLKPNQQLKVVDITGYMGFRFPQWISSMSSLTKISISNCGCEVLPSLGQLPLLKELQLKGMPNIEYIGPKFYGAVTEAFPSLEQLGLYDMPILFTWSGAKGSGEVCRSLKTLTIEGCPQLYDIPTFRNLRDLIVCNSSVGILSYLNRTRFGSPSTLLIKNMEFGNFLEDSMLRCSLKKLILFNSTRFLDNEIIEMLGFTDLEHLGIAHCPQVRVINFRFQSSIQKLHVVDCPNLERIYFNQEAERLTELVVDGCPELHSPSAMYGLRSVTKLIIRSRGEFLRARDLIMLKELQYLSISECPLLEKELEMEPSPISHIPYVILGNHKVEYQESNDYEDDTMSALFDSEHDSRQESTFKGSSSPGSNIVQWPPIRAISKLKHPLSTPRQLDSDVSTFWSKDV